MAASNLGSRLQVQLSRLVGRPVFWTVIILAGLLLPVLNQVLRRPPPPLPVLGKLNPFSLTNQEGHRVGSEQLQGHVWVASFIFTRCPTICPAITQKLGSLQKRARNISQAFRIVSFSVDPQHDTPEVLADYGRKHKVSPRMWHLLTGPLDDIRETVEGGLKMAMGNPQGEQDFASLFHGTHLVLVDAQLQVRGYYDSSEPEVLDKLLHDATMLINRGN